MEGQAELPQLRGRIEEAIRQFHIKMSEGKHFTHVEIQALIINYLKKALHGYMTWTEIGKIKPRMIMIRMDRDKLLQISIEAEGHFLWNELTHKLDTINNILSTLKFESLYKSVRLGKFPSDIADIINSVTYFKI